MSLILGFVDGPGLIGLIWLMLIVVLGALGKWYQRAFLRQAQSDFDPRNSSIAALRRTTAVLLRSSQLDQLLCERSAQFDASYELLYPRYLFDRCLPHILKAVKNEELLNGGIVAYQYDDDTWRSDIVIDLERAQFILMAPLYLSEALIWELDTIRGRGWMRKLFFLMPPASLWSESSVFEVLQGDRGNDPAAIAYYALRGFEPELPPRIAGPEMAYSMSALRLACEWQHAAVRLAKRGVVLAKYLPEGGLLAADSSGQYRRLIEWKKISGANLNAIVAGRFSLSRLREVPEVSTTSAVQSKLMQS